MNNKYMKIKRLCKYCDKEFKIEPYKIKRNGGKYCSLKCAGLSRKGENNPNWKGGKIKTVCKYCGKIFEIYPFQVKIGEGKYCSKECYRLVEKRVKIKCKYCGKLFEILLSGTKYGRGKYCSLKCYRLSKSGENSSWWKGGKKARNKRYYDKYKNDLKFQLNQRISSLLRNGLKAGIKNGRTWQSLVGYNVEQLKRHLKSTMPDNYSWKDFLKGDLHIDHIIPINTFNFEKPEDLGFKQCWALENLQLLPKSMNLKKSNKLIRPFQTNLSLELR